MGVFRNPPKPRKARVLPSEEETHALADGEGGDSVLIMEPCCSKQVPLPERRPGAPHSLSLTHTHFHSVPLTWFCFSSWQWSTPDVFLSLYPASLIPTHSHVHTHTLTHTFTLFPLHGSAFLLGTDQHLIYFFFCTLPLPSLHTDTHIHIKHTHTQNTHTYTHIDTHSKTWAPWGQGLGLFPSCALSTGNHTDLGILE